MNSRGPTVTVHARFVAVLAVVFGVGALVVQVGDAGRAAAVPQRPVVGESLVGRWAHYDAVAYQAGTFKTLIVSYGFNDFTESNGKIIDSAKFCFAEQRTNQPVTTSISDAATQAIKPPSTPLTIRRIDGRLHVHRSATPTPVGIRLARPATDRLPSDPNDPRIVDSDRDGKPGITVTIDVPGGLKGELYLARREIFAWNAVQVSRDLLRGTVTDTSEQLVVGASSPIFAPADGNWVQVTDLTKSPIELRRVGRQWDCAKLAAERDRLFPPTPVVDW